MSVKGYKSHPYIPNSVQAVQDEMLKEIGVNTLEDLHDEIPKELILKENLNLPKAIKSEFELKRHVSGILKKNITCEESLNFLGAGCYQHYVPAICDEINSRAEFLTAYGGEPYEDHGRFQTLFEYQSLLGELLDMDVVNVPTFDCAQAAATSAKMAARLTGRSEILVPKSMSKDKFLVMKNYGISDLKFTFVDYEEETGLVSLKDLENKLSNNVAAVYFENPNFLGLLEENGAEISELAHKFGALSIVGVDVSTLGVVEAPANYGADIVCGDIQPLGMHMNFGGGQAGFMATRDEEKLIMEFPSRLFGIAPTCVEGEYGFGDVAYERTSFALREGGKEFVGTQAALWGITAGVYLGLMGPKGMQELGQTIMQKSEYIVKELSKISGVKGTKFNSCYFKEFVVDFNETGKTVKDINKALLEKGIFGGKDLSQEFSELGQCALYCVTETMSKDGIDTLVNALREIL